MSRRKSLPKNRKWREEMVVVILMGSIVLVVVRLLFTIRSGKMYLFLFIFLVIPTPAKTRDHGPTIRLEQRGQTNLEDQGNKDGLLTGLYLNPH